MSKIQKNNTDITGLHLHIRCLFIPYSVVKIKSYVSLFSICTYSVIAIGYLNMTY